MTKEILAFVKEHGPISAGDLAREFEGCGGIEQSRARIGEMIVRDQLVVSRNFLLEVGERWK